MQLSTPTIRRFVFVLQENVSCLNTTLVFLMFANQKNRLPQYLRALSQDRTGSGECSSSCNIMKNFRDLLLFWQDHYLHKDKDCSALEKVCLIPFVCKLFASIQIFQCRMSVASTVDLDNEEDAAYCRLY